MSGLTLPTDGPVTQDFLGSRWGATPQPLTPLRPHTELSAAPVMGSFQIGGSVLLHFELEDFSPEAFAFNEEEEEENGITKSGNDILSLVPSKRPNALLRLPTELTTMTFKQTQDQSPCAHGGPSAKRYYTEAVVAKCVASGRWHPNVDQKIVA
ncbi:hypothetical protein NLJ89_g9075 [Agrocybe chaxingu]|uniref:Uncharacterized protein n=1 Tax=Agrocybe chaxingu TaxID=84603 RepID=A0A9W8JTE9_9AGAR|nr:hypothetical protein NLJ89_g9075 [Agrocybe chaxingu]